MSDTLIISGALVISIGAGLIYVPAGFIVGGIFLLIAGLKIARGE